MRGDDVIIVDGILDEQFPVCLDVVFLGAGDDFHLAGWRLVNDEIDVILGAREIVDEGRGLRIKTQEPEVAIGLEARHLRESVRGAIEFWTIGFLAGDTLQRSIGVEGPAVVHAVEAARVALAFSAHHRAAMAADIEHGADFALRVAAEQDRAAGDLARLEVARCLHLRGMTHIDPAGLENALPLASQHVIRDEDLPIDQEGILFLVFKDIGLI